MASTTASAKRLGVEPSVPSKRSVCVKISESLPGVTDEESRKGTGLGGQSIDWLGIL